jgi:hypothetical protein
MRLDKNNKTETPKIGLICDTVKKPEKRHHGIENESVKIEKTSNKSVF